MILEIIIDTKNDIDDSLFCLITFGAFLYGVEIDRVSWSWDPCH